MQVADCTAETQVSAGADPAAAIRDLQASREEIAHLERQLAWFERQLFGRKSERRLIESGAEQRKLVSLPIGVSGADLGVLGQFSNKPAIPLKGLEFRAFFLWLSASMARVSASTSSDASVQLPPIDSWASI